MFNKVFISYAREDFESAAEIYEYLATQNFSPWMDKKNLLIGHRWENQIMNEIRIADFIILLLSKVSVAKRGFVQREFKYALKYAEEKLNSDIFILPIKLDDCEVPNELAVFNWAEFDNRESYKQIVQALNHQRNEKLRTIPKELINLNDFTENEVKLEGEINKVYDYKIKYPIFPDTNSINTEMLNIEIKHFANKQISFLNRELLDDEIEDTFQRIKDYGQKLMLDISYSVGLVNEKIASILFYEFLDFLGAHPNHSWTSINVMFNPNRILTCQDISNLDKLGKLIRNYKYEFAEINEEEKLYYLEQFSDSYDPESNFFYPKEFEFFLSDHENILINFSNHLPHVSKALGQFEFKYKIEKGKIVLLE